VLEKILGRLQVVAATLRVEPTGVRLAQVIPGQGTQQLVDLDDRLAALGRVGAAYVAGQVLAGATNREELQFIFSDALLPA